MNDRCDSENTASLASMSDDQSFLRSQNVWILIPLAALSIPIIAVLNDKAWLGWVLGAVAIITALTVAGKSLMNHRHSLRLKEIEAQERLARTEHEHLASAQRILELDDVQERLKASEPPTPA